MLILKNITKIYQDGDQTTKALDDVSINFRENEFVSILGESGCGKSTFLNTVGGLCKYTSGDLIINGKSTKDYTDAEWDTYRNHTIGFIFQSYNLISHLSVVENVELALTISGVSKKERRRRAIEAIKAVGLEKHIYKKPSQLSGGMSQRISIARSLINEPDILFCDEPTGALDSENAVMIMNIIKKVAKEKHKLVIMVTHNPALAEEYSDRILKIKDGKIIDDSSPYVPMEKDFEEEKEKAEKEAKTKKPSMNFWTAFSLSLKNLMTKKTRTILSVFAASIGILGIALILSLSNGISNYIDKTESDMLKVSPMTIEQSSIDMSNMVSDLTGLGAEMAKTHESDKIYVNESMTKLVNLFVSQQKSNNITNFKKYIDDNKETFDSLCSDIQYKYSTPLNIYKTNEKDTFVQVNPITAMDNMLGGMGGNSEVIGNLMGSGMSTWTELIGDEKSVLEQYDLIYGKFPKESNEVVLIVDKNNEINEMLLYALGLKDQNEFQKDIMASLSGTELETTNIDSLSYNDICNMKFKLVLNYQYMVKNSKTGLWKDMRNNPAFVQKVIKENGIDINIVGILRPNKNNTLAVGTGSISYLSSLMSFTLKETENSDVVKAQLSNPKKDVISGLNFVDLTVNDIDLVDVDFNVLDMKYLDLTPFVSLAGDIDLSQVDVTDMSSMIDFGDVSDLQKRLMEGILSDDQILALKQCYIDSMNAKCSYGNTMDLLGYQSVDSPTSICFYPKNFDTKEELNAVIDYYNKAVTNDGHTEYQITVTDPISFVFGSLEKIINVVSVVLIAFVSVSLVVSSILVGVLTLVSVAERTPEIGLLVSLGCSKKDIGHIFNSEAVIIGLSAGLFGVISTYILQIPINFIIKTCTTLGAYTSLSIKSALILVCLSFLLTLASSYIASSKAKKLDPVVALRSE